MTEYRSEMERIRQWVERNFDTALLRGYPAEQVRDYLDAPQGSIKKVIAAEYPVIGIIENGWKHHNSRGNVLQAIGTVIEELDGNIDSIDGMTLSSLSGRLSTEEQGTWISESSLGPILAKVFEHNTPSGASDRRGTLSFRIAPQGNRSIVVYKGDSNAYRQRLTKLKNSEPAAYDNFLRINEWLLEDRAMNVRETVQNLSVLALSAVLGLGAINPYVAKAAPQSSKEYKTNIYSTNRSIYVYNKNARMEGNDLVLQLLEGKGKEEAMYQLLIRDLIGEKPSIAVVMFGERIGHTESWRLSRDIDLNDKGNSRILILFKDGIGSSPELTSGQKERAAGILGILNTGAVSTIEPPSPVGGIDFNAANLNLQIKRDGHGVPLPISQQDLQNIKIDGLVPIIIDIKPAASLAVFADLQSTSNSING